MRPARLAPFALLIAAPLLSGGPEAGRSVYILDRDGRAFAWREGEPLLSRATLPWDSVDDLAALPDGRHILVLAREPGALERRKAEGLAVVLEESGASFQAVRRVPFEGRGLRAIVTGGGHRAYIVSFRPPPTGSGSPTGGRSFIHEVDLDTARVLSSAALNQPVLSVAAGRGGRRIYVGVPDRILTYDTSPLTSSWYYRSPGPNLGLSRPGDGAVLFSVRGREVAMFDPAVIDGRSPEDRRRRTDDASTVLALADPVAALLFAPGGTIAAVYGGGLRVGFLNSLTGLTETVSISGVEGADRSIRPIGFSEDGSTLRVAILPDAIVESFPVPVALGRPPAAVSETAATPPAGTPPAALAGTPVATPAPVPPSLTPAIRVIDRPVLQGVVTGDRDGVAAIVLYGPDSLIREQARVLPGPDGAWEVPLPPPGTYRVMPIGPGSRTLRSTPNFWTVAVKAGEGLAGIGFRVETR